ncbi:MAG: hypothetical protein IT442_14570 [Phycisphaeraceae bacterium]|nr:hypothetical protein [Phycisphaeraceae bacterium]
MRKLSAGLIFLLSSVAWMAGCDGYLRVMYFREPSAPKHRWAMGITVITVPDNTGVEAVLKDVAVRMGLQQDADRPNYWGLGEFSLAWWREEQGLLVVRLMDFPTTSRSDLSKAVEAAIREGVAGEKAREGV